MIHLLFTADPSFDLAPAALERSRAPAAIERSNFKPPRRLSGVISSPRGQRRRINQKTKKMQNKPNSCRGVALAKTDLSPSSARLYESLTTRRDGKNNEKTNPIKPNPKPNKPNFKSGGFAVDYRSNFGYNTATFQEFVSGNAILKVKGNLKAGKEIKMEKQKKSLLFAAVVFGLFMSSFVLAINDPIAHWKFDETSGLIAEDSAGDNDGVLVNDPIWTTGIIDGALDFDGVNEYVEVGDPADESLDLGAADSLTVAAWIRCNKTVYDTRDSVIVTKRGVSSGGVFQVGYHVKVHMDKPRFNLQDSGGIRSSVIGTSEIRDDQWHHVVAVRDRAEHKLHIYVDGIADAPAVNDATITTLSNSNSFGIGKYQRPYSNCFGGLIDEVIIYDRALSAEEIQWLYLGEEPELVGLEITGPDEVPEDSQTQYSAIALYDNDSTADVTDDALWSVEPNVVANIEAGLLVTEKIFEPEAVTITAQYTKGEITIEDTKGVSIFAICPSGSALEFDGADDYVDVGDPADESLDFGADESFSITAWIKCDDVGGHSAIVGKRRSTGLYGYFYEGYGFRVFTDGTLYFGIEDTGNNGVGMYGNTAVADNQWHHVVAVRNVADDKLYIYVDGNSDAEPVTDTTSGSLSTTQDLWIGLHRTTVSNDPLENPHYFSGLMDEVCIYNRALSAQEIQISMHVPLEGDEPNLVGYWDFDEGSGQVAHDTSGSGNDGQLGTFPDIDDSDPNWVDSDAPVGICTLEELVERNVNNALEIKLNILKEIEQALLMEDASVNILGGLFGELDLDKRDIRSAGREIHSAIQSEEQAVSSVEKSVDDLEDSLDILAGEDESPESSSPNGGRQTNRPLIPRKK